MPMLITIFSRFSASMLLPPMTLLPLFSCYCCRQLFRRHAMLMLPLR